MPQSKNILNFIKHSKTTENNWKLHKTCCNILKQYEFFYQSKAFLEMNYFRHQAVVGWWWEQIISSRGLVVKAEDS